MTAGILYAMMMTIDRVIISSLLSFQQLGYYSLSILIMGMLSLVPTVVGQQIYPRMAEAWGKKSKYTELRPWIRQQIFMSITLTLPLVIATFFIMPFIVKGFLNEYSSGITAMKISLIAPLFLVFSSTFANFLNTIDKQVTLLLFQFIAVCLNIMFNLIFIKLGFGISGVAAGTTMSFILHSFFLYCYTKHILRVSH